VARARGTGEEIVVDESCLVAFQNTLGMDVRFAGGCATVVCGGEGFLNTVLKGPGLVILESFSIKKLRDLFKVSVLVAAEAA
jgi:uncharacterized protein (AIM24 family)